MSAAYLLADASRSIGLGHVSRAIAVARALGRGGIKAKALVRELDPGCAAAKIHAHADVAALCSSEDERVKILEQRDAKYLFIDLPSTSEYAALAKRLKPLFSAYKTVCFDTYFDSELPFGLFIRPLFGPFPKAENVLSGLQYYMFPEELRELAPSKKPCAKAERALISLGGSDPHGATPAVARALCAAFPDMTFRAVVGPGFAKPVRDELTDLSSDIRNLDLLIEPESLGRLYLDSDLAVTSGGLTKFETALFGIPTAIVANGAQEESLSKEFAATGASVFAGRADALDTALLVKEFGRLTDAARAAEMSRKGREALDARGGERVIEQIKRRLP